MWRNYETLQGRYDVPLEAIVKSDLLRVGVTFTPAALEYSAKFKEKSYFIFSFDRVTQKELKSEERHKAPEEFALIGGPQGFKRTIVSTRLNPQASYTIDVEGEGLALLSHGEKICEVQLNERPAYYSKTLSNGKPVTDITPTIEWGYLIYLTAFRLCQYWGSEEECAFCDINENYRQQKKERSYTGIKSIGEALESLAMIDALDTEKVSQAYTVTGGAVTKDLSGMNESQFYAQYAEAIEKKFSKRWIGKVVVQALPLDEVKILKNSGYTIYHPNYEVWDKTLFTKICPGKERYIGRDEWMKRIIDSAKIFGPEHVIPNFVAGIEMAKPHGYKKVEDAIQSTVEGLDFFMSQGVCPRFTVWCVEPNTTLAKSNREPPPLEYYVALLEAYRRTFKKYRLPVPPGYGKPGLGNAVFSVSAFMDIL